MASAYNPRSRVSIIYNDKKLPTELRYSSGHIIYYGYDRNGKRSYIADNHGYNISYVYDSQFRLVEVRKSSDNSLISRFDYVDGVVVRKVHGNGAYSNYTYDKGDRPTQLDNYLPDGTLSSSNKYEYDLKGKVMKITDSSNQSWSYFYDVAGRLSGWQSTTGENVRYLYDRRGNRLRTLAGGSMGRYSVNRMNQYMSFNNSEQFFYDPNGNLVRKVTPQGTESYQYDPEGKLILTETANDR